MKTASKIFFQILTIVAAIFFFNVSADAANSADYQFTRVSGNSMLPTMTSGETAVVYKAYPFKKLDVGDIVIIENKRGFLVIHRIVRRFHGETWVTQGDNNRREDREVLTSKNFGGLALVDSSMERYQKHIAQIDLSNENGSKVAFANTQDQKRPTNS